MIRPTLAAITACAAILLAGCGGEARSGACGMACCAAAAADCASCTACSAKAAKPACDACVMPASATAAPAK